jgi:hypothetical protein
MMPTRGIHPSVRFCLFRVLRAEVRGDYSRFGVQEFHGEPTRDRDLRPLHGALEHDQMLPEGQVLQFQRVDPGLRSHAGRPHLDEKQVKELTHADSMPCLKQTQSATQFLFTTCDVLCSASIHSRIWLEGG